LNKLSKEQVTLTTQRLQLRSLSDNDIDFNPKDDHVTLGYWIGKTWWGEGAT